MYSEVSNKHRVVLILFEKIFPTTCLIRKTSTFVWFWKIFLPTRYQNSRLIRDFRVLAFSQDIYLVFVAQTMNAKLRLHQTNPNVLVRTLQLAMAKIWLLSAALSAHILSPFVGHWNFESLNFEFPITILISNKAIGEKI